MMVKMVLTASHKGSDLEKLFLQWKRDDGCRLGGFRRGLGSPQKEQALTPFRSLTLVGFSQRIPEGAGNFNGLGDPGAGTAAFRDIVCCDELRGEKC